MLSILMLMCDLAKAMQLLCGLIVQNGLLTLVVQYGTELRGQRLVQKSTNPGHSDSRSLFFGPSSHNTPPVFEVSGVPLLAKVTGSR